jgi:hypothetical protein
MRATMTSQSALKIRHLILFVLCLMYFIAYVDRVNISEKKTSGGHGSRYTRFHHATCRVISSSTARWA